jgi:hypothetical protein
MKSKTVIITSLATLLTLFAIVVFTVLQTSLTTNQQPTTNRMIDVSRLSDTPLYSGTNHDISRELITLPINVFLIHDESAKFSTNRNEEDVRRVIREMNKIWSQADISIEAEKFLTIEVVSEQNTSIQKLVTQLKKDRDYDEDVINIYFARTLDGPNGIAFPADNVTFVADYTSVNDYRASSHEIGHVLGLTHTNENSSRLMFSAVNGTDLTLQEIEISRSIGKQMLLGQASREVIVPEKVLIDVPFTSQAPFGEWSDPKQDYGCEEASSLMVWHWLQQTPLTPTLAKQEIISMSDWQLTAYGDHHDTSSLDSVKFFTKYFDYSNVVHHYDITIDDIKTELAKGNPVIAPVNGELLENPYYTPPGPLQHMIVIKGYDDETQEFIANDPGTKRGESIRYSYENLGVSLQDYTSGWNEPIEETRTAMIVIEKP